MVSALSSVEVDTGALTLSPCSQFSYHAGYATSTEPAEFMVVKRFSQTFGRFSTQASHRCKRDNRSGQG